MARWPYNTTRWRALRKRKLEATPRCEYCPPRQRAAATQVDHRIAIKDGGNAWAWGNLASSCHPCHSRKTVLMDGGCGNARRESMPVRGCDASGRPLDPDHWWNK